MQPFAVGAGFDEVFDLHLLEFPGPEGKVARRDFISECLAYLGDAEGKLFTGGVDHVGEVDEDALGGLGAQVHLAGGVLHRPHECFEHQVELTRVGQLPAALRAEF